MHANKRGSIKLQTTANSLAQPSTLPPDDENKVGTNSGEASSSASDYANEILRSLDSLRMWTTLIALGKDVPFAGANDDGEGGEEEKEAGENNPQGKPPYDPHLVLSCLLEALKPTEWEKNHPKSPKPAPKSASGLAALDPYLFIARNALSFAFAATSVRSDESVRRLGYAVLARFLKLLSSTTTTTKGDERENSNHHAHQPAVTAATARPKIFKERPLYTFVLRLFKRSVATLVGNRNTQNGTQHARVPIVPRVVAHFFARLVKLMLQPGDACYAPLMAFVGLKFHMRMDTVPEFFKLFFSSSTEHHRAERQWMLKLCAESVLEANDYQMLCKVYVLESCMAFFITPIADLKSKLLVLRLFERCAAISSSARDMCRRLNFPTWVVCASEYHRTTEFEALKLADVFLALAATALQDDEENLSGRKHQFNHDDGGEEAEGEGQPAKKRARRGAENGTGMNGKSDDNDASSPITKLTLRMNSERILARLINLQHSASTSAQGHGSRASTHQHNNDEQMRLCVKRLKRLLRKKLA